MPDCVFSTVSILCLWHSRRVDTVSASSRYTKLGIAVVAVALRVLATQWWT